MQYANAVAQPRQELTEYVMEGATYDTMFIGLQVLPPSPLKLPTGHVPKITIATGDLLRAAAATRAPGAEFNRWQAGITDLSLTLLQVAEELLIPDEQELVYSDYFSVEQVFSLEARRRIQRQVEVLIAAAVQNTSTFTATNSTVAWTVANAATLSFIQDTISCIRRVKSNGELPDTIAMSGPEYDIIRTGTLVQNFIAGANQPGAVVNPNTIQRAFEEMGIKKVLIGDAYVNQSVANDNSIINAIWSKAYAFVGKTAEGSLQSGGIGRTFFWEKEGPIFNVSSYRAETRKSNVVRCISTNLAEISNARAGQLITTQS